MRNITEERRSQLLSFFSGSLQFVQTITWYYLRAGYKGSLPSFKFILWQFSNLRHLIRINRAGRIGVRIPAGPSDIHLSKLSTASL